MLNDTTGEPGKTILVVEDEVLIRMVVADYMEECGYRVLEAGTGAEAIAMLLSTQQIDVVFTDVQMPGTHDGFQLCRWINDHRSQVVVLITSGGVNAHSVPPDLRYARPMLAKPYPLQDVFARVRAALGDGPELPSSE